MSSTPQTLNIVQYNVNKSRNRVMTAFFRAVDPRTHHVMAVQEPWRNPQMPTSVRPPNYHLFYPLHSDTRVCFYVSKELDPDQWSVQEHSPDFITLTIQLECGPLHIHNCYNEPPKLATSRELGVLRLLPQALHATGQHVLVGDFNLHHPMWSGVAMPTQHALADDLIEIALQADLELVLPPGSITWRLRQSMNTLDLAFTTSATAA